MNVRQKAEEYAHNLPEYNYENAIKTYEDGYQEVYNDFLNGEITVEGLTVRDILELKKSVHQLRGQLQQKSQYCAKLESEKEQTAYIMRNREKFIDFMIQNHPDAVAEYLK